MLRDTNTQWVRAQWYIIGVFIMLIAYTPFVKGQAVTGNLVLRNDYIAILVNNSDENTGRFSIETTGGDPNRTDDNNQLLLYRQPNRSPRTSYTTVAVDGDHYVFGGSTQDRAGHLGTYGDVVQMPTLVTEDGEQFIISSWQLGPILVTQQLQFARSSTTGLFDTAEIAYTLTNTDGNAHDVGLRVVLDTMLGQNDGAPFRMGEEAILTDTVYQKDDLPDFWQAFDSLNNPRVIGQGTFRGHGITTPDRVYLTNWGSLADGIWDFSFRSGRDFTRLGEFDLDSAMALFFDEVTLQPGESEQYVTHYGLGGISIVRGKLNLGITSPASIDAAREKSFPVVAYVVNNGESEALDVAVRICVPRGLSLAGGQACETRYVGDLPLGRESQVRWDVLLSGAVGGELEYSVQVTAENMPEPVVATRSIDVLGPPRLALDIHTDAGRITEVFDRWQPPLTPIEVTVTNEGGTVAKDVVVSMASPVGMVLAQGDREQRYIGALPPGESRTVTWHAALLGYTGNLPFTISTHDRQLNTAPVTKTGFLDMVFPERAMLLLPKRGTRAEPARVNETVAVDIQALNIRRLSTLTVVIQYDPEYLRLIQGPPGLFGSLRGDLFTLIDSERTALAVVGDAEFPWSLQQMPSNNNGLAQVRIDAARQIGNGQPNDALLSAATGTVGSLRFKALRPGETELRLVTFVVGGQGETYEQQTNSKISLEHVTVNIVP